MKRFLFLLPLMVTCMACQNTPDIEDAYPLAWLEGCWKSETTQTLECWQREDDQTLSGSAESPRKDGSLFREALSISYAGDALVYTAKPGDNPPTAFTESQHSDSSITFVNPDHDYPQRIKYTRTETGLTAEISLINVEKAYAWDYVAITP